MIEHKPGEVYEGPEGEKHRLVEGGECNNCSLCGKEGCHDDNTWCVDWEIPDNPVYYHYERVEE